MKATAAAIFALLISVASGVDAAPTSRCGSNPGMIMVVLYGTSTALQEQIVSAFADHAAPTSRALLDRMGDPIALNAAYAPMVALIYDNSQDVNEVVERMRRDTEITANVTDVRVDSLIHGASPVPQYTFPLIEFYNGILDHYFMAWDKEAAIIDAGGAGQGWSRTGQQWIAYDARTAWVAGLEVHSVFRFYGEPGVGPNSHFFTAGPQECGILRNGHGWAYEGVGFGAALPVAGACPMKQPIAVYRFYNNRAAQNDSNHRHVSDPTVYGQMMRAGWIVEGIAFCLPSS